MRYVLIPYQLKDEWISFKEDGDDLEFVFLNLGNNPSDHEVIVQIVSWLKEDNDLNPKAQVLYLGTTTLGKPYFGEVHEKYSASEQDILFAADANFISTGDPLEYYLWKYYPRGDPYEYLNKNAFIGTVEKLEILMLEIIQYFKIDTEKPQNIDVEYFARYFVDTHLGVVNPKYPIFLDSLQEILGSSNGRMDAIRWPSVHWIIDHLRQLHNPKFIGNALDYEWKNGRWLNIRTKKTPSVIIHPNRSISFFDYFKSIIGFFYAVWRFVIVCIVNQGQCQKSKIFRYKKHSNPEYDRASRHFVDLLESNESFTFAHFNDGELNFIRKYLEGDHKKTWTGRLQNQYDRKLAERLIEAIQFRQTEYHIGVNCTTCGSKRRVVADKLMGDYDHKVGSMVLHHNLYYLPQILSKLRNREVYFVINNYQDLGFLIDFGIDVQDKRKIVVPFVNSYSLYDQLKDQKFPDGAVVLLMCGMLAKILNHVWYEKNPKTTFIAFGSTMDDFIQLKNTKYSVYPRRLPLTRNIFGFKTFLLGPKKVCKECYSFED